MDFTAVHVHFHDLQPFCNSLKISNHNHKNSINEHSIDNHYYFKVTIGFQCLTTIRYGEQGIGWACWGTRARIRGGGGGSGSHRKITRYMGSSRSKHPAAPDEISLFRAWGGAIYFTGMH